MERHTSRWRGPLAGIAVAALALGLAELLAALLRRVSPVVSVGNRVVDNVPVALKTLAIDLFGTNDKVALIAGTLALLTVFAAAIGWWAQRRRLVGVIGIGLFGVLGALAALGDVGATARSALPSLVGAAAAAVALDVILHRPRRAAAATTAGGTSTSPMARRNFILGLGAVTGLAAASGGAGRLLRRRLSVAASRARLLLPSAASPAQSMPAGMESEVPEVTSFITPNDSFYRIDTALSVPQVDPDQWRLEITGMVERELSFTLDQILERPLVERVLTLVCVSNEVGGTLVGTARWLGVPLRELLEEAGVQRGADQLVSRSVDGYTAGSPLADVLDGREALLAVGMNGEPLPTAHGFPARLVVPGLYGYVSATKWVTRLEVTRFEDFDAYWVPRGYAQKAPVKTSSRIDTPKGLARIAPGKIPVAGVAWATHRGISTVEVRIDEGPWLTATLSPAGNDDTWRQWLLEWNATSGRHTITCRATDGDGQLQEEMRSAPLPDGATGWHQIVVLVD